MFKWLLSFIYNPVLNGVIVTINQVNPLRMGADRQPCITGYVIADQISGQSTTVNSYKKIRCLVRD